MTITDKQVDAALDVWFDGPSWEDFADADKNRRDMRAALEAADAAAWEPIATAPKGGFTPYTVGPEILGVASGDGRSATSIVRWHWHKDTSRGSWKNREGRVWEPTHWRPIPASPKGE